MKKIKTLLLAFAIVLTALQSPVQVSAHGHGSGGGNGGHHTETYGPCSVSGCNVSGQHQHGSKRYSGHSGHCVTYSQCNV